MGISQISSITSLYQLALFNLLPPWNIHFSQCQHHNPLACLLPFCMFQYPLQASLTLPVYEVLVCTKAPSFPLHILCLASLLLCTIYGDDLTSILTPGHMPQFKTLRTQVFIFKLFWRCIVNSPHSTLSILSFRFPNFSDGKTLSCSNYTPGNHHRFFIFLLPSHPSNR